MAKILDIDNDIVSIGLENGTITEVRMCDLNFAPQINDEVEVYSNDAKTYVTKKKTATSVASTPNFTPSNRKEVNKLAYVLCAILLGGLGVHHFIAGKAGLGILHLLFCWTFIPSIVGLIQGIIACTKHADTNGKILV